MIILASIGYFAFAIMVVCHIYACRRADGWRKLYEEKRDALRAAEGEIVRLEFYKHHAVAWEEMATVYKHRLEMIRRQLRRMKGRKP